MQVRTYFWPLFLNFVSPLLSSNTGVVEEIELIELFSETVKKSLENTKMTPFIQ